MGSSEGGPVGGLAGDPRSPSVEEDAMLPENGGAVRQAQNIQRAICRMV